MTPSINTQHLVSLHSALLIECCVFCYAQCHYDSFYVIVMLNVVTLGAVAPMKSQVLHEVYRSTTNVILKLFKPPNLPYEAIFQNEFKHPILQQSSDKHSSLLRPRIHFGRKNVFEPSVL